MESQESRTIDGPSGGKHAVRALEEQRRILKIEDVGKKVLSSDVFEKARHQIHHHRNTVADHTMEVSEVGLHIAESLEKRGIPVNENEVIRICLLHDMGIVGRYQKFRNNFQTNFGHPKDSVRVAEEIYPGISEKEKKDIARHMFPSTFMFPTNREGWILVAADKIASMHDVAKMAGRFFRRRKAVSR